MDPCPDCSGTGLSEVRCRNCHAWKPVGDFLSGGILRRSCSGCRGGVGRVRALGTTVGPLRCLLVEHSHNRKTGPVPVSLTSSRTCPTSCPWRGGACYGRNDFTGVHWRRLDRGAGTDFGEFCDRVSRLPRGSLWRHNEAGDLPGDGDRVDPVLFPDLVEASRGTRGFTYTHKPVLGEGGRENRALVSAARGRGLVVNLSADGLPEADRLSDLGVAQVVAVVPSGHPRSSRTPAGRRVVACPATYREDVTCSTCGLCARDVPGRCIVAFPAHGTMRRLVDEHLLQLCFSV